MFGSWRFTGAGKYVAEELEEYGPIAPVKQKQFMRELGLPEFMILDIFENKIKFNRDQARTMKIHFGKTIKYWLGAYKEESI